MTSRISVLTTNATLIERPEFDNKKPSLEDLQEMVGGYIERVFFPDDPMGYWHYGWANEEGLLKELPPQHRVQEVLPPVRVPRRQPRHRRRHPPLALQRHHR